MLLCADFTDKNNSLHAEAKAIFACSENKGHGMKRIESKTNPIYRSCKNLLSASGIREEGKILVAGRKIVPEYLKRDDLRASALLISDPKDIEKLSFKSSLDVFWLKGDLFKELDEAGTHFPLLVLDAPKLPVHDLTRPPRGLEVVLALSNPLNMGAALRACEAFEAQSITLLKECAHPFLPKVLRASSGSSLMVNLGLGPSITELKDRDTMTMTALDKFGENLFDMKWPADVRIFLGEEGRGVPPELNFKQKISIPIKAGMDSLNAVSAASVALFSYRNAHRSMVKRSI